MRFVTARTAGAARERLLKQAAAEGRQAAERTEGRDRAMRAAWDAGCSLREIAEATGLSHTTVRRLVDRVAVERTEEDQMRPLEDTWSKYENRYTSRPETYRAYVDVWTRISSTRNAFSGWASFSQAANAEPAQSGDKVRAAEECMRAGGYKLGSLTPKGARRWAKQ